MAYTLVKFPFSPPRPSMPTARNSVAQCDPLDLKADPQVPVDSWDSLPCVLYELNAFLQLTYISANVLDLIGIDATNLLGGRKLWEERMLREEAAMLFEKLNQVDASGSASAIHRIIDDRGLPVWVAHSFRKAHLDGKEIIRGCLVPMRDEERLQNVDRGIMSRFIHKIGNQFQLLNLVVNSLQKGLPETKESEVLQQTVEKAIELTRTFSDYGQVPTCVSEIDLLEILRAAVVTRKSSFAGRGVHLEERIDESAMGVTISGDPFLLEMVIGGVLQNALEATERGGKVILRASVEISDSAKPPVARLCIADTGCGIREEDLDKITMPFFTSKKDHDGLGLSMSARFIEMLGGVLRIDSLQGKGTEVHITFPTNVAKQLSDR